MSITVKKFENACLGASINTYIDSKQNVYFIGRDIASHLGYSNTAKAINSRR